MFSGRFDSRREEMVNQIRIDIKGKTADESDPRTEAKTRNVLYFIDTAASKTVFE
jgi:hypothetical protein